jgi:hypothetical protein
MDDEALITRIGELVEQEHELEGSHGREPLSEEEQARLRQIQERLDQCWDLLRQRRARRAAGQDPDEAEARPTMIVESYRQ